MNTHNIYFHGEIRKNVWLDSVLIWRRSNSFIGALNQGQLILAGLCGRQSSMMNSVVRILLKHQFQVIRDCQFEVL